MPIQTVNNPLITRTLNGVNGKFHFGGFGGYVAYEISKLR